MTASRFHGRSTQDEVHRQWKTGYGALPGMLGAEVAQNDLEIQASTAMRSLKRDSRLAGLSEYERFAENERIKYDKLWDSLAQQWKLIDIKAQAIVKANGDGYAAMESQFQAVRDQKMEAEKLLATILEREKAKYDELGNERLREVVQSIDRFKERYHDAQVEAAQVGDELKGDLLGLKGMDLDAAEANTNRRISNWIQSIDRTGEALYQQYTEAWQKIAKTQPEGWEKMHDEINDLFAQWSKYATTKKAEITAAGKEWADLYIESARVALKARKADVETAWQEVFGSKSDLGKAQSEQLLLQGIQQGLQFPAGSKERERLYEIFQRKAWEARTLGSSDMAGGMAIGMQEWEKAIPSQAELGLEAVNAFRSGIEGLSSSIADLLVDGKANFEDLARSVAKSLATMTLNAIIATTVMNALNAVTGFRSVGKAPFSGLLASGYSITPRAAGGAVSPGEWYLVGEKGPELLRAGGSGHVHPNREFGGGLQTTINVTVNGGASGSGKPGDNKAMADQLASAVKATFNDYLREQMRPGGLLNQGRTR